jgi:hypothetical protein
MFTAPGGGRFRSPVALLHFVAWTGWRRIGLLSKRSFALFSVASNPWNKVPPESNFHADLTEARF